RTNHGKDRAVALRLENQGGANGQVNHHHDVDRVTEDTHRFATDAVDEIKRRRYGFHPSTHRKNRRISERFRVRTGYSRTLILGMENFSLRPPPLPVFRPVITP